MSVQVDVPEAQSAVRPHWPVHSSQSEIGDDQRREEVKEEKMGSLEQSPPFG